MQAKFFHTDAGTAFVDLLINGNRETWPIRSKRFRTWLRRRHYEITRTTASAVAINSALDLLEAQAQFEGPEREVRVRLAEHAGHIYLDLADEYWRAVEIGPHGWRVIGSPPVRFRRAAGMLPLPVPRGGCSIEELASFLNLPSRNDFVLVVAWLLATLRAGGPYPVLAICGEQGSAKTVLSKLLKALVDPNVAPGAGTRARGTRPRDRRQQFSCALHSTICPVCPMRYRTRFAGSPRARASDCASSIRTQTRCCFKRRAPPGLCFGSPAGSQIGLRQVLEVLHYCRRYLVSDATPAALPAKEPLDQQGAANLHFWRAMPQNMLDHQADNHRAVGADLRGHLVNFSEKNGRQADAYHGVMAGTRASPLLATFSHNLC
jgi:hypothetical protein